MGDFQATSWSAGRSWKVLGRLVGLLEGYRSPNVSAGRSWKVPSHLVGLLEGPGRSWKVACRPAGLLEGCRPPNWSGGRFQATRVSAGKFQPIQCVYWEVLEGSRDVAVVIIAFHIHSSFCFPTTKGWNFQIKILRDYLFGYSSFICISRCFFS